MAGADMPDVNRATEIRQRPGFFVLAAVFLGVITYAGAWMLGSMVNAARGDVGQFLLAVALFILVVGILAIVAVYAARRAVLGRAVVLRLDPAGIWHRFSTKGHVVAWRDITRIVLRGGKGGGLKLTLRQEAFRALFRTGLERLVYRINWLQGPCVLSVHVAGLDMGQRQVADLTQRYAAAHGGPELG